MIKQGLIGKFVYNHWKVTDYIDRLDEQKFIYSLNGKWSAGQHLQHILLTIMPFSKVLSSKEFIQEKFGYIDRLTWDYETVLDNYLKTSLKAPEQFLPKERIHLNQKTQIISEIHENLKNIENLLNQFSEDELDTMSLPHPLLGKLTIREMFYLMSYHPLHHMKQIEQILEDF